MCVCVCVDCSLTKSQHTYYRTFNNVENCDKEMDTLTEKIIFRLFISLLLSLALLKGSGVLRRRNKFKENGSMVTYYMKRKFRRLG